MNLEKYAERSQFYTEDIPSLLSNSLDSTQWDTLLDLGCGDGALLSALNNQEYLSGKTVLAVDLSQSRLNLVKRFNEDIICVARDVCDTQLQGGSVDFLISTQVVEHVANDADMVKEIRRVLAVNGTVYLATVFKKWYGWYFYRCNGKWTLDPTHLREYTRDDQLLDILDQHDFDILATKKTLDGRPIMDSILRRIGAGNQAYKNRLLKALRSVSIPLPGYYIWEILGRKKKSGIQVTDV